MIQSLRGYLIDTNVLLRLSRQDDPLHDIVRTALEVLDSQNAELYFALQNIAEFWNVCTRPANWNGYGLSVADTSSRVDAIERTMKLLTDDEQVYSVWRQIVLANKVSGVQVHDARLAAAMYAHDVTHILTFNDSDFARFAGITAVHPKALQAVE